MKASRPNRNTLSVVLRLFREAAGYSQEQLAIRAGLHRNYVSSAERGERNVSFEALDKWLVALDRDWVEFAVAIESQARQSR